MSVKQMLAEAMKETVGPPLAICARSAGQIKASPDQDVASRLRMLRQHIRRPRIRPRFDVDRPKVAVVDILQRHPHDAGPSVDIDTAEELQPETRREIFTLLRAAALLEHRRWPERVVELARSPCPRMQRPGDELP